jgi:hypothetical protein
LLLGTLRDRNGQLERQRNQKYLRFTHLTSPSLGASSSFAIILWVAQNIDQNVGLKAAPYEKYLTSSRLEVAGLNVFCM